MFSGMRLFILPGHYAVAGPGWIGWGTVVGDARATAVGNEKMLEIGRPQDLISEARIEVEGFFVGQLHLQCLVGRGT